jgi:hypothetical protein
MTVDRASKVTAVVDVGNTPFVNARIQAALKRDPTCGIAYWESHSASGAIRSRLV